jgi:glycosyltransferase involved in cell wall biosynthesis
LRILIVSVIFPPLNSIASLRPYSWARAWSEAGHDVTVLTERHDEHPSRALALPACGFRRVALDPVAALVALRWGYRALRSRSRRPPAVAAGAAPEAGAWRPLTAAADRVRVATGIFSRCRMPDLADFWIPPALRWARRHGPWDVAVSTAGPYAVHVVAARLKRRGSVRRWIADYRDPWSDSFVYPGLFPFSSLERRLEPRLLRHADAITTVSTQLAERFGARYGMHRVHTIENGFDPTDRAASASAFADDGKLRIVYTGSFYRQHDPSPLFRAVHDLAVTPATRPLLDRLEIVFAGPSHPDLEALVERAGVGAWVRRAGFVARPLALAMQRDAHHVLLLAWGEPAGAGVIPGKLYEYLASGSPILSVGGAPGGAADALVRAADAGRVFGGDVAGLTGFLADALRSPTKAPAAVPAEFLARYDRRALARRMLDLVACS